MKPIYRLVVVALLLNFLLPIVASFAPAQAHIPLPEIFVEIVGAGNSDFNGSYHQSDADARLFVNGGGYTLRSFGGGYWGAFGGRREGRAGRITAPAYFAQGDSDTYPPETGWQVNANPKWGGLAPAPTAIITVRQGDCNGEEGDGENAQG